MEKTEYYNDMMARMEELFYHELSDCSAWKTEFIGVDFIQAKNIKGDTREDIIENCLHEIIAGGLVEEASYAVAGKDVLLYMKIKGCIHLSKEVKLKQRNIKPYNCPITNMITDQLIERLNFETTYLAEIQVEEESRECTLKCAIYETSDKIGCVSDWSEECRLIDANDKWKTITMKP